MSLGNTKFGDGALQKNKNGWNNTAFGTCSSRDTDISWNTSVGAYANMSNVTGISNVCMGTNAHLMDISGSYNTALGTASLLKNQVNSNTAVGSNSMENNITGKENVAVGVQTGYNNDSGEKNVFVGSYAGFNNVDGSQNIFLGYNSGIDSLTNHNNIFIGCNTTNVFNHTNSTVIGNDADMLISNGIILGKGKDNNGYDGDKILIPGEAYVGNINHNSKLITQKELVEYASVGIILTDPCDCATTTNISLSGPPPSIDGVTLVNNMRVLVRCQEDQGSQSSTSSIDNGIYVFSEGQLVRASDCLTGDDVAGQSTFVRGGITNKNVLFKQISNPAIVDSDELNYVEFWNLSLELGNGLDLSGNTLNVKSNLTDQNGNPFLKNVKILGTLDVSNNLTLNSKSAIQRQIRASYYNLSEGNINTFPSEPNRTDSRLFHLGTTGGNMFIENVTGNTITFTFSDPSVSINVVEIKRNRNVYFNSNIVDVSGNLTISGNGNYLQFPDGTRQTTAYEGGSGIQQTTAYEGEINKTYSVVYTATQSVVIPPNCVGISVNAVGAGGLAGNNNDAGGNLWHAGGSGGGASCCISNNILPITSGTLVMLIGGGVLGYARLKYNSTDICWANNGFDGSNATSSAGGAGGSAQTNVYVNNDIGSWTTYTGSAGTTGGTNLAFQNCSLIPANSGKPQYVLTTGATNDGIRGCGQRYSAVAVDGNNHCQEPTPYNPIGAITITYYFT
jgi:hypothetical protein